MSRTSNSCRSRDIFRAALSAICVLLTACGGSESSSVNTLFESHRAYDEASIAWIRADLVLIQSACSQLTPSVSAALRAQVAHWNSIVADNPVDDNLAHQRDAASRLQLYGLRSTICSQAKAANADLASYHAAAIAADNTSDYKSIDEQLKRLRDTADLEVAAFPSPELPSSNYSSSARALFFSAHQQAAASAGAALAKAVDAAREASGEAAKAASSSGHESDQELAKSSDSAYGEARESLASLSDETDSSKLFAGFENIMNSVDISVASADATLHDEAANPVSKISETLPVATFEPLNATPAPIPTHTPIEPPPTPILNVPAGDTSSATGSSNADGQPPTYQSANSNDQAAADSNKSQPSGSGCAIPDAPAHTINQADPEYPQSARDSGATGNVTVKVNLDSSGGVQDASIYSSSGNQALDDSALQAARSTTYSPAIHNCVKEPGSYLFEASFNAQ
jgi:TonB family protein